MTRVLPSGLEVKTGHIPKPLAPHLNATEREYVMLGQDIYPFITSEESHPGTRMIDAILAVTDAFKDPIFSGDETVRNFKNWLVGFEVKVREWSDSGQGEYPVIRFMPRAGDPQYVDECSNLDLNEPGPTIHVMGHDLTRSDFIFFTDYLMTNSAPTGSEDPRIALIEGLKFELTQQE